MNNPNHMNTPHFHDHEFRTASFSGTTRTLCVEVAIRADAVAVCDSKDKNGRLLCFSPDEWRAFVKGVKAGEFDM